MSERDQSALFGDGDVDTYKVTLSVGNGHFAEKVGEADWIARWLRATAVRRGGQSCRLAARHSPREDVDRTWAWDGMTWTERVPAASPAGYAFHPLAFDSARGQVALFGGFGGNGSTARSHRGRRSPGHRDG